MPRSVHVGQQACLAPTICCTLGSVGVLLDRGNWEKEGSPLASPSPFVIT